MSAVDAPAGARSGDTAGAGDRPPPPRRRRPRHLREYLLFLAFIVPNFFFVIVFAYWPVLYNAYLSLTSWNMLAPVKEFVGLANYTDLLTDGDFLDTLRITVVFVLGIVLGSMVLGLAIAVLLNERLVGRGFVRTMAFAPHILSGAAIGTIWLFIFDPNYGLLRPIFGVAGLASPNWMTSSTWALPGLIIVYLWKNMGFIATVYLAGLQNVPRELYEAAAIDGSGPWHTFRKITFPMLSPVTFFLVITTTIGTFQAFDIIALMTGGGPGNSTTILSWFIYQQAFKAFDAGHAAAAAMLMFVVLIIITALQARFLERKVHYR
ncbi:glycerol-3-phosphate ABC transporter permease [Actinocatenispora thailandica]|uniref:Glycerol-3-phosphate ABC transporter permease n=1 Tax=Actinocatenispora thailandica TaxID=227318 RepID=A0A7R7DIZ8_9ACTN|nr:sugar ABC transporter permease [Actinocatenispora thailandica]BCJ32503.1 glycerol-3-phosphate ABC transporter permease [Actinocatenispora thailandica]